jgi:RNA polymerase sigma-70 factor, ECF subfamily
LALLSAEHREALLLVGAQGMSSGEAGAICGVPIGTIKSRVHRARTQLASLMDYNGTEGVGVEAVVVGPLAA